MSASATNAQKTPLAQSLGLVDQRAADNRQHRMGKNLPCSLGMINGSIVQVNFEMNATPFTLPQPTMPAFGPEYIRYPYQKGDMGVTVAADAYLGQMSGLGSGTADLREPPNLGALVFLPVGNQDWTPPEDTQALICYGPNGVILRDKGKLVTFTLTPQGIVIDLHGNGNVTIQNGDLHVTGAIIAGFGTGDQVGVQTHTHHQGADSHGDSEAPTNPPTPGT